MDKTTTTNDWRQQRVSNIGEIAASTGKDRIDVHEIYTGFEQYAKAYYLFKLDALTPEVQDYANTMTRAYYRKQEVIHQYRHVRQLEIELHSERTPRNQHYEE